MERSGEQELFEAHVATRKGLEQPTVQSNDELDEHQHTALVRFAERVNDPSAWPQHVQREWEEAVESIKRSRREAERKTRDILIH